MNETEEFMKEIGPRKELSSDFTQHTLKIATAKKRRLPLNPKLLVKRAPALAALAAVILVSSVAYAALNWPQVTSKLGIHQDLSSGNKIIGVDTTNCNYFSVAPGKKVDTNLKLYYEIKGSSLSDEQVVNMIQGVCEETRDNAVVGPLIGQYIQAHRYNLTNSEASLVELAAPGTLTVKLNSSLVAPGVVYSGSVTFKNFSPAFKAFDRETRINYDSIKAGNTVILIVEAPGPITGNPWLEPQKLTILDVVRVSAHTGSAGLFYSHLGTDFVRVEPCKSDPSGFCRAYQFIPTH
jgi:hypothetical protein